MKNLVYLKWLPPRFWVWSIGYYKATVESSPLGWSYVLGEGKEIFEELGELNFLEALIETQDFALCALSQFAEILPISWFPVLPGLGRYSALKFYARLAVWQEIFSIHGVDKDAKLHLAGGGNYHWQGKVRAALRSAGYLDEPKWHLIEHLGAGLGCREKSP